MSTMQPNPVRTHPLDKVAVWTLLGTVVLALFMFIPSASVPFTATKSFLLAVGATTTLVLFILARLSKGNVIIPSTWLLGVLWLPLIGYALSAVFSGVPFTAAFWGVALEPDTFGFMLAITILGTVAAIALRRREQLRLFSRMAGVVFVVLALLEAGLLILARFVTSVPPGFSLVGSMNDLAMVLGLGMIGTLLASRFLSLSRTVRRILFVSGLAALFVLAVTGSSIVWTLLALVSLGLFVEAVMRRGNERDTDGLDDETVVLHEASAYEQAHESLNRSPVLPLVVLVVALFFLFGSQLGNALAGSLHVNVLNIRPSWQSTLSVAQKTYATSPIFGSGPGTFGTQWLKYRVAALNTTPFWNVDFASGIGFIPTSLVTTGGVGAVVWIGFLVLFLMFGLRMLIVRTPRDQATRYIAMFSFIGTVYLFCLALFDLPSAPVLALAFVFAGVFISSMRFAEDGRQLGIIFSRSPKLGFVVVFILTLVLLLSVGALYSLIERYIAIEQVTTAAASFSAGDLSAADQAAQTALSFAPLSSAYQVQASVARARLNTIVASTTLDKATAQKEYQAALSAGINAALTATKVDPSNYQNWLALGDLYAQAVPIKVSGAYDSAHAAYEKAQALNPTNPQIHYVLAELAIANKDTKTAEAELKKAIGLKQNYTAAIFLLSQLEVRDGNIKDALSSALAAAYFTPNNPDILFQVGVLYAAQKDYTHAAEALSAAVAANTKFANARYLLAAVYAKQKNYAAAAAQLKAIAAVSSENAKAVASSLSALEAGKDPFPKNLLAAPPASR